jgi:hypothetical protein
VTYLLPTSGPAKPLVYLRASDSTPETLGLRAVAQVGGIVLTAAEAGVYRIESTLEFATAPTNIMAQTLLDLVALVAQIQGLSQTGTLLPLTGLAGTTIAPGVYDITGATGVTLTVTLDAGGDPDAIFVFRVTGTTTFGAGNVIALAGGAQSCNVYWLLDGAAAAGGAANLKGTIICIAGGMAPGAGLVLEGRLLSTSGALTLTGSTQTLPAGTPSTDLSLDLNLLAEFAYYTGVLGVADATQASGVGSIGSGSGGTIVMANQVGKIYTLADVSMDVHFDVSIDGVAQPDCTRHFEGHEDTHGSSMILMCTATVDVGATIATRFASTLGGVVIGNRSAFAWKLA